MFLLNLFANVIIVEKKILKNIIFINVGLKTSEFENFLT